MDGDSLGGKRGGIMSEGSTSPFVIVSVQGLSSTREKDAISTTQSTMSSGNGAPRRENASASIPPKRDGPNVNSLLLPGAATTSEEEMVIKSPGEHPQSSGCIGSSQKRGTNPAAERSLPIRVRSSRAVNGRTSLANVEEKEGHQQSGHWELVPLWSTEEERQRQTIVVDFNASLCQLVFGTRAHQAYLRFLAWATKGLGFIVRRCFDASLLATCATLLLDEKLGTPLSILALVGALPANLLMVLGLNIRLLGKVAKNAEFWIITVLMLVLWATVGVLLGGTRGVFLSVSTAITGVLGGPIENSWHYRLRSSAGAFVSWFFGTLLVCTVAASMALKVFKGGKVLRWPLGSRYLSGEDIVIHSAATLIIYFIPHLVQGGRSIWRRVKREDGTHHQSAISSRGGTATMKKLACLQIRWPLVLQQVEAGGKPLSSRAVVPILRHQDDERNNSPVFNGRVPLIITLPEYSRIESERSLLDAASAGLGFLHRIGGDSIDRGENGVDRTRKWITRDVTDAQQVAKRLKLWAVRVSLVAGVLLIPTALSFSYKARDAQRQQQSSSHVDKLKALCITTFVWNLVSFLYLSSTWNLHILRLLCRSSFDFWFLFGQCIAALLSLSDAFQYDERCLIILAWCFMYTACLLSDSMLPLWKKRGQEREANVSLTRPAVITKTLLGLGVLLPLLATQCWFLYNLFYYVESLHLRFRIILRVTKYLEIGVEEGVQTALGKDEGGDTTLDFSTDSFIIARLTSIIILSFPFLYHLLIASAHRPVIGSTPITTTSVSGGQSSTSSGSPTSDDQFNVATEQPLTGDPVEGTVLYFLTGYVSYAIPVKPRRR